MKPGDPIERISITEALIAARNAAFTETDEQEPRTLLHSFTTGGLAIGADWDLDAVIDYIESSYDCAWRFSIFRHELVVLGDDGRTMVFDVERDVHAKAGAA